MNKRVYPLILWLLTLLLALPGYAQYGSTPVVDGNISDGEYTNQYVNNLNTNKFTSTNNNVGDGGTWYMTWDATDLYVAKTGGSTVEPTILYFDLDPTLPVTGGGIDNGNLTGLPDYFVTPSLPFRADARVYFYVDPTTNNPYVEVRRKDKTSSTGWGAPIVTGMNFVLSGTNREIRVSWNSLTGTSIPAMFNWLGYCTNKGNGNDNYRYDQAPTNPMSFANGNSTPANEYYYTVASTGSADFTKPFILRSYTFPQGIDNNSFGAIDVWDFTMNSTGHQISRGTTKGTWNISGSLVVGNGTVYFGDSNNASDFGDTNVGNVRVLGLGILSMNQSPKPLNVREDIDLTGGGQFVLSGAPKGDLFVGRDFFVKDGLTTTNGTFQASSRAVVFTGSGVTHTVRASGSTSYQIPFNYIGLDSPGGSVVLGSNIFVANQVNFNNGMLLTGNNYIQLDGTAVVLNETMANHIVGNTRITQTLGTAQAGVMSFGNLGLQIVPQNSTAALGDVTVTRVTGTALSGVGVGSGGTSIQRYFVLTNGNSAATPLDLQLLFTYRPDEQNGIMTSNLSLYQSATGAPGTFTRLTPPSASTGTTVAYTYTGPYTSGTYFTLGDGAAPLPVTLVSFTAAPTAQGAALLHWVTANELNSKGFGIERQLGSHEPWQQVGYVAASNALTGSAYDYTDKSLITAAASPLAYYRLRQEDFNGALSYSPVAVVTRPATAATKELLLSPVPVTGGSLSMTFAEAGQAGLEVAVINTQGQRLLSFTTEASNAAALSLPVDQLAAGVYIVSVRVPGQSVRHARFVKL